MCSYVNSIYELIAIDHWEPLMNLNRLDIYYLKNHITTTVGNIHSIRSSVTSGKASSVAELWWSYTSVTKIDTCREKHVQMVIAKVVSAARRQKRFKWTLSKFVHVRNIVRKMPAEYSLSREILGQALKTDVRNRTICPNDIWNIRSEICIYLAIETTGSVYDSRYMYG